MEGPSGRRGKWSQPGVPHKGWICINTEDLGKPDERCGMCESKDVRYVHYMQHYLYPDILACGAICAGHMESDLQAAQDRDKSMRDADRRRKNFPKLSTWKVNAKLNHVLRKDGATVTVFHRNGLWKTSVTHPLVNQNKPEWGKFAFATAAEAKAASFDDFQKIIDLANEEIKERKQRHSI